MGVGISVSSFLACRVYRATVLAYHYHTGRAQGPRNGVGMSRTYPRVGVRHGWLTVVTATLLLAFITSPGVIRAQPPQTLDIYWIDVEGGAATLVVTPQGESVLMDAGWPRPDFRDTERIQAAMRDAGITTIDYLLISHFHTDHVGGLPQLAERVPIGQVIDHGDSVEQDGEAGLALWRSYEAVADGRRRTVEPGDKLPPAPDGVFVYSGQPPAGRIARTAAPKQPLRYGHGAGGRRRRRTVTAWAMCSHSERFSF